MPKTTHQSDLTPIDVSGARSSGSSPNGSASGPPRGEWIDPAKSGEIHPHLQFIASLMDDIFEIPGTKIRIGIDGLIGLIPVLGDLVTFLIAGIFLQEAERLGVSRWTKMRMVGNTLIDLGVGAIPFVGDLFDFGFKANRKNLKLLQEHVRSHSGLIDVTPKHYSLNWPRAVAAALAAAAAITVYMLTVPRWFGVPEMDIGLTIGALMDAGDGPLATFGRLAWHVGNGIVYVLIYAAVLRRFQRQSSATTGAIFGVLLWFAGPMLLIPAVLNAMGIANPGLFMVSLGWGLTPALLDLGAHLVHGVIAGSIYKHVERRG